MGRPGGLASWQDFVEYRQFRLSKRQGCPGQYASMREPSKFPLFLESVWRDLRLAVRGLIRAPGFTSLVVLCLALGIGANVLIFSLIDGILLRPVAVPRAENLVTFDTAASRETKFG